MLKLGVSGVNFCVELRDVLNCGILGAEKVNNLSLC